MRNLFRLAIGASIALFAVLLVSIVANEKELAARFKEEDSINP